MTKPAIREIESAVGQLARCAASPFDTVCVVDSDGRYVLRQSFNDAIELRVRHRKARRRMGVVVLPQDATIADVRDAVTTRASEVASLPPYCMDAYAYIEDPDDPTSPWRVSVHVDHESGAERSGTVAGLTRKQAEDIADAMNLAAALLAEVQR